MDTIQKSLLGVTIGAVVTASVLTVTTLVRSGVWYSKRDQLKEITELPSKADELILYAATGKYSAKVMFIEHCETRLATWTKLHGIPKGSTNWNLYHDQYLVLLATKFK